jgi:hypothetical protein
MTKKKGTPNESQEYPLQETYKGRQITIKAPEEAPALEAGIAEGAALLVVEIDDDSFEVLQEGPQSFQSIILPYSIYESPLELAKDAIDYVPRFKTGAGS